MEDTAAQTPQEVTKNVCDQDTKIVSWILKQGHSFRDQALNQLNAKLIGLKHPEGGFPPKDRQRIESEFNTWLDERIPCDGPWIRPAAVKRDRVESRDDSDPLRELWLIQQMGQGEGSQPVEAKDPAQRDDEGGKTQQQMQRSRERSHDSPTAPGQNQKGHAKKVTFDEKSTSSSATSRATSTTSGSRDQAPAPASGKQQGNPPPPSVRTTRSNGENASPGTMRGHPRGPGPQGPTAGRQDQPRSARGAAGRPVVAGGVRHGAQSANNGGTKSPRPRWR